MRNMSFIFISVLLISCSKEANEDISGSPLMLCADKKNKEVCDLIHDGAFCSRLRADSLRTLVIQSREKNVKNAYAALTNLDDYKACLDNTILAQSVRRKSDEVSRFYAVANISDYQNKIVRETKGIRPEINLWRYTKTGNTDYWESMVNGVDMAEHVHNDVYTAMMAEAGNSGIDEAKKIADLLLDRTEFLNDLPPEVFELYVLYYLESGDDFKSAVWNGLYAEYVKNNPGINIHYFKSYKKMQNSTLDKAQKLVDSIIFDTDWIGLKISELKNVIT
ncbi:MAG: hypothetical protein ACJAV1_003598 [Paraglaciecola sp.]|jgi:hypothetical protein